MRQHRLQRRQHPLFSPVAIWSTMVLVVGLGVGVFRTGGRAFSPGDLSADSFSGDILGGHASHADFHDECAQCHAPFLGVEAARCEACHTDVAEERQTADGLHGRFEMAEVCADCHTEHQGADFNLLIDVLSQLDHDLTRFSLAHHQEDYEGYSVGCTACHAGEGDSTLLRDGCVECHQAHDADFVQRHASAYGTDCLGCHDGIDTLADFNTTDHAEVFVLIGAHQRLSCEACHRAGQFEGTAGQCAACHEDPDLHQTLFGNACTECHTAEGWIPAMLNGTAFSHDRDTRFRLSRHRLNFDNAPFTCLTCHPGMQFEFSEIDCGDCHSITQAEFVTAHINQVGTGCLNCHDGSGQTSNFDHSSVWPLVGAHLATECAACHTSQFAGDVSRDCQGCHQEPQIHLGMFGIDCATCHTAEGWLPARLTRHVFPLDHGEQGEVTCLTCHPVNYAEYSCFGCHEHDLVEIESEHNSEGITYPELQECVACHPTGREHEAETDSD